MRKAQAAMEYLITYGWAVLIMLVVIGVLFYLGIFNPKPPTSCTFGTSGFSCYAFKVMGNITGNLILDIGQATGHDIKIFRFNCTAVSPFPTDAYNINLTSNITIPNSDHRLINTTIANRTMCTKSDGNNVSASEVGTTYKGKLFIEYMDIETGFTHKVYGDIVAPVEAQ
jgi:hypothetical protein